MTHTVIYSYAYRRSVSEERGTSKTFGKESKPHRKLSKSLREREREMGDFRSKLSSWWSTVSSSSPKLLCFIVPLIVVSGFVALLGPKTSNWVSISHNYAWPWRSSKAPSLSSATIDSTSNNTNIPSANDSVVNDSASPPLSTEAIDIQERVRKKEDSLNVSTNEPPIVSSMNETLPIPMTMAGLQKEFSNLERLEASLVQVRAAIREAKNGNQSQDPDYVPTGPMYRNAKVFHRSYLEMEREFKVYVYEEGDPPVFHSSPCDGVLAIEGHFIHHMEISQFRTRDPEKAHVFFLPFSVVSIVHFVYVVESREWGAMKNTAADYINVIARKYPYWNRSLGADHFMLACHDWGPEISFAIPYLYSNSIRALCNANTSERFNLSRDVSIPEIYLPTGTTEGLIGGPSASRRSILVFYAGGVHGPIRPVLLEHWENKDEDVQIHKYLPKGVSYYGMMRKSKYCICPSGYEVASPRMVEALYMGCVPVLIKDHYAIPFSDVLNWKTFSVEVPVKEIPNLKKILMGISQKQYIRMQRRGLQVRRHFEVNMPPKRFDVFHMILHSIWLRRLNVQIYDVEES